MFKTEDFINPEELETIPETIPKINPSNYKTKPETIPDKIIILNNFKEACEKSITFKIRIDEIRTMRNKLLKDSDYYLLPDISLEENKLKEIKEYRQQLREFMNKLMNDELNINIFDDEFEKNYFPKLML